MPMITWPLSPLGSVPGLKASRMTRLVARLGALAGRQIDAHQADAGRHAERHIGLVLQRLHHEVAEDRRDDGPARRLVAERARLVVADIEADGEIGREADEPGVVAIVGGAGLAGERLADGRRPRRCRAARRPPSSRPSGRRLAGSTTCSRVSGICGGAWSVHSTPRSRRRAARHVRKMVRPSLSWTRSIKVGVTFLPPLTIIE